MRILLVEDKDSFRKLLVKALADGAWDVTAVGDPREALAALKERPFEALVTDLRLPGMTGLELLKAAKRLQPAIRAVVMSAFGETRDIVEAIRWGADDFLAKPFDLDAFLDVLARMRALGLAPPPDPREPWIAVSGPMTALDRALSRAAESGEPVLFHGEAGAGKARAARRLHALRHPQAPFLRLSAAGRVPGPDDLAVARGGSLYLTDLDQAPSQQALAAAMDLPGAGEVHWMGACRQPEALGESLRMRLGVLAFGIAPLRERREDVLPLFRAYLEARSRLEGRPVPFLERGAERDLLQRGWPGNVRELAWCLDQALAATAGPALAPLPPPGPGRGLPLVLSYPPEGALGAMLDDVTAQAEGALLRRALEGREPAAAAQALGLTLRTLAKALRDHGIPLDGD